jgi:transmembrane sensor
MPRTDRANIDASPFDQALDWFVTLSSGEVSDRERSDFERWLQDPEHRRSWLSIETFQRTLQDMPAGLAGKALRNARRPAAASSLISRRRLLGVAGAVALGALLFERRDDLFELTADVRTATGEQRTMTLADGSKMVLDSATAVDIRFDGVARRVVLRSGAVMVETAHRPEWVARPFIVDTGQGSVQALGTRFTVRALQQDGWFSSGRAQVAVFEGEVDIRPRQAAAAALRLKSGTQASFDADRVNIPEALGDNAEAWTQGMLVARNRPLGDFVEELRRYRSGVLRCDDAAAAIRITGVFPLDDTDRILDALAHAFPLDVRRHTRYWTSIAAKDAPPKK